MVVVVIVDIFRRTLRHLTHDSIKFWKTDKFIGYFPETEIETPTPRHFGSGAGFWVFRPWNQSWRGGLRPPRTLASSFDSVYPCYGCHQYTSDSPNVN